MGFDRPLACVSYAFGDQTSPHTKTVLAAKVRTGTKVCAPPSPEN
jgi:hypothetical protein